MASSSTPILRLITRAYRSGIIPPRGCGVLFDRTPSWLWGGDSVTVDTKAGQMTLPLRDHGPRRILVFGRLTHEDVESDLLAHLAPRLRTVIDIGANVGWYSCLMANSGLPADGRILAVEPNPAVLSYLRANAARHSQITVIPVVAAAQHGDTTFYAAASSDLSSALRAVGKPLKAPATTVDQLAADYLKECRVDLVKCDVEGGELAVLRGARKLQASPWPPIWLMEANERFLHAIGSSFDEIEAEIRDSTRDMVSLYSIDRFGRWFPLRHLRDIRDMICSNVLVLPECRRQLVADLLN
jgi:FkbM family methyltransferase